MAEEKQMRSYNIQINPDADAIKVIERDMKLMEQLYGFIIYRIESHIQQLREETEYGEYDSNYKEYCLLLAEAEQKKRQCEVFRDAKKRKNIEDPELESQYNELSAEIDKLKKHKNEWCSKCCEFFRSNRKALCHFVFESRRKVIRLKSDMVTPTENSGFILHYGVNGEPYYIYDKTYYMMVEDSIRKANKGDGYSALVCECGVVTKRVSLNEDKTFKDKVYDGVAVLTDDGEIIMPYEYLRIDNLNKNNAHGFSRLFVNEYVYSLNKNPQTKKSQKTSMTYKDYGLTSHDFDENIGNRLTLSYADFPELLSQKHRKNDFMTIMSGQQSKLMDIMCDESGGYFVRMVTHSYGRGKKKYVDIPVLISHRNKNRIGTERDMDTKVLERKLQLLETGKTNVIGISKDVIRGKSRFCVNIFLEYAGGLGLEYNENSLNQKLGLGPVGVDPGMHQIAVYSDSLKKSTIFSLETICGGIFKQKIYECYSKIDSLQKKMSRCMDENNCKAKDEKGNFIKGKKLFKSKRYMAMQKEVSELYRRIAELKETANIFIAHKLLSYGNVFYIEDPRSAEKKRRMQGVVYDANGRVVKNRKFGRSIQKFSISGMIYKILDVIESRGGKIYWINNESAATAYVPKRDNVSHGMGERVFNWLGHKVQRDMKSGYVLSACKELEEMKGKKKYLNKPIYKVVSYDDERLLNDVDVFAESVREEMERCRDLNVEDKTIGIEKYFNKN